MRLATWIIYGLVTAGAAACCYVLWVTPYWEVVAGIHGTSIAVLGVGLRNAEKRHGTEPMHAIRPTQGHYFEVVYRPGDEDRAADTVARWANDPSLPFDWHDATEMGKTIRSR